MLGRIGKSPTDPGIPSLEMKNLPESKPPKSRIRIPTLNPRPPL